MKKQWLFAAGGFFILCAAASASVALYRSSKVTGILPNLAQHQVPKIETNLTEATAAPKEANGHAAEAASISQYTGPMYQQLRGHFVDVSKDVIKSPYFVSAAVPAFGLDFIKDIHAFKDYLSPCSEYSNELRLLKGRLQVVRKACDRFSKAVSYLQQLRAGPKVFPLLTQMSELDFGLITPEQFLNAVSAEYGPKSAKEIADFTLIGGQLAIDVPIPISTKNATSPLNFRLSRTDPGERDISARGDSFFTLPQAIKLKLSSNFSAECEPSKKSIDNLHRYYCMQLNWILHSTEVEDFVYNGSKDFVDIEKLGFLRSRSLAGLSILSLMTSVSCDDTDIRTCGTRSISSERQYASLFKKTDLSCFARRNSQ